jgi:hypothetical protein
MPMILLLPLKALTTPRKNLQQNPWTWLISPLFGCKIQLLFCSTVSTSILEVAFFAQKLKKLPRAQSFVVGSKVSVF